MQSCSHLESEVLLWMSWLRNNTHPHAQGSGSAFLNTDLSLLIAVCHFAALGGELMETRKQQGNPHRDMELKGLGTNKMH